MQPLAEHGGVPDKIRVCVPAMKNLPKSPWLEFPLVDPGGNPLWRQHPNGPGVDVAALAVTIPPGVECFSLNDLTDDPHAKLKVAANVYILGFPRGIAVSSVFPVWKRATLASEPGFDLDGYPMMLVDTATREGMSGSPVFLESSYVTGDWQVKGDPTHDNEPWRASPKYSFIGIYSGRVGDNTFQAQLGIVWKRRVIDELLGKA